MVYVPHYRLSLLGTLPDGEIFSNSLSFVREDDGLLAPMLDFNQAHWDDIVADAVAYWGRETSYIHADAVLKRVKMAPINAQGLYAGPPREAAVNKPGWHVGAGRLPHQISRKVTLNTAADLGRVKGGFFVPLPYGGSFDYSTNLFPVSVVTAAQASVQTFISDIENAPGADVIALKCVVASQGRKNKDGSVRLPAGNYDVTSVSVGRRADVQRRRANKLSEARIAALAVPASS